MLNSVRMNVDTGVIAPVAPPPPSLSLWQGVICDLGDACPMCLGMVPEGCQAGPVPQILELLAEMGIQPTHPGQVALPSIGAQTGLEGDWGHPLPGSLVLWGQIISTL